MHESIVIIAMGMLFMNGRGRSMPIDNSSLYQIPCDLEAERAVLGAIILNNQLINEVAVFLTPSSFQSEGHKVIYKAILELTDAGRPIDEIMLGDQLKEKLKEIGGYAYLAELTDCVPSSGNIVYYARILHELSLLRDLITATSDISRRSRDPRESLTDLLMEVERKISDISQKRSSKSTKSIHDVICDSVTRYEERSKRQDEIIGVPTLFSDIDRILLGLTSPDLITIAADSSVGKTTLALNFIENIYTRTPESRGAFICSREMANYQLTDRMICSTGKIDSRGYKIAKLGQNDMDKMIFAADSLSSKNIHFNDEIHSVDQIIHEMRHLHKTVEGGLCIAVVDYLQLLEGAAKSNREQEIAYCSRSLKRIAKELNIVVIQLSQLNRELRKRPDKRPIRSDLRESASIEHDSDIILFLYRDDFYNEDSEMKGFAEVDVNKNRNGDTGKVFLKFLGSQNRFLNVTQEEKNFLWNALKKK